MNEPELNSEKEHSEEKEFLVNFASSDLTEKEKLNQELRDAIKEMTRNINTNNNSETSTR